VAVFGAGGVGLSTILGAKLAGASPIVAVDVSESKLNEAKRFGATHGVSAGEAAVEEIRSITGGRGADYVFEAVGIPSVQESCLASARPGGTVVFSGIAPQRSTTNISGASLTRESKTVKGCYYGSSIPARDFPRFSELYLAGLLDLDALVTKRYSLPEINEAYADMLEGRLARGVVVFDGCR
jgi:S-(hydroxymethyl)glutathione dehydrogenase/alcohol dehydrogenase